MKEFQKNFLNNTLEYFKTKKNVEGIMIGGSFLYSEMDEFSDLDLIIVCSDESYPLVFNKRKEIASELGDMLSSFSGEHVGEPRLLICLYLQDNLPLHVDLKFIKLSDSSQRVEDSQILLDKNNLIRKEIEKQKAKFPFPDLQWIEDRFWIWIHYVTTKLARGEIFETISMIDFLRNTVISPLLLMKYDKLPRGVRKIEFLLPKEEIDKLQLTIPSYNTSSCLRAINTIIEIYLSLQSKNISQQNKTKNIVLKYLEETIKG